jgi:hypothetical protein
MSDDEFVLVTDNLPNIGKMTWPTFLAQLRSAGANALDGVYQDKAWEVKKRQTPAATTTVATAATGNLSAMSLPIGVGETWAFDYFLPCACSGTGGTKFTFSFSGTGGSIQAQAHGNTTSVTAFRTDRMTVLGTLTAAYATFADASGTSFVRITGTITGVTGAGTLQIQHASTTAGQTSTVYAGAYLVAHRIS